jgi:hypothetical protein
MNLPTDLARIEDAFNRTDCAWVLDYPEPTDSGREKLLIAVAKEIDEFRQSYHERFGDWPDPFQLVTDNREKATAFFEIFSGPPLSTNMRVLIWRLLEGLEIRTINWQYEKKRQFFCAKFVIGRRGGDDEVYETEHPWDFTVLRHLGMLTVSGALVLDGYYASRYLGP